MKKQLLLICLSITLSTQANERKSVPIPTYSELALASSIGAVVNYGLANCNFRKGTRLYFGAKSVYLVLGTCAMLVLDKKRPLKRNQDVSRMHSLTMSAAGGAGLSIPLFSEGCTAWALIVKDKKR